MISRQRRALWQAVSAAEFAVLAAQQAGAPAAELDALCRRLRLAAEDADRQRARRPAPASPSVSPSGRATPEATAPSASAARCRARGCRAT